MPFSLDGENTINQNEHHTHGSLGNCCHIMRSESSEGPDTEPYSESYSRRTSETRADTHQSVTDIVESRL